jgi:hypothetical protein
MEVRETYYELYLKGDLCYEGYPERCMQLAFESQDDELAEIYKVTVMEEKVTL